MDKYKFVNKMETKNYFVWTYRMRLDGVGWLVLNILDPIYETGKSNMECTFVPDPDGKWKCV